jgi:hypothetical protein
MSDYNTLKNAAVIETITTPVANTDLGSDANRYGNIFLQGNLAIGSSIASESNLISPRISSISYVGDDTAADPIGGQSITITGSGFRTGAVVYVAGSVVSLATVISPTTIAFTAPAKSAGNYTLIVVNEDGGTATFIPGVQYSGTPVWSTSAGSLANVYEYSSVSSTLSASSDSTVSYSVSAGALPTGITLGSANGIISGTTPAIASGSSTYNFTADAKDGENQDTTRNFSITVNADAVTWNSPANASVLTATSGTLYSQALSATSAAGKSITYTANSLPTGLSISGANITGTPTVTANTASLITATAATTGKTANITLNFAVAAPSMTATGGTVTTSGNYKIHTFTGSGTFTVTSAPANSTIDYLAVGGGAGGGSVVSSSVGGGGAGGLLQGTGVSVSATAYTITIGAGSSSQGSNSSIAGSSFTTVTALGGGAGVAFGIALSAIHNGGSGGGGSYSPSVNGGTGTTGQGKNGGKGGNFSVAAFGGGGGGAGAAGGDSLVDAPGPGGVGGIGIASSITGTSLYYAGGGGGGVYNAGQARGGNGGLGGGGGGGGATGATASTSDTSRGATSPDANYAGFGGANTGGGGGGASPIRIGGTGGSGVVIIRYQFQ